MNTAANTSAEACACELCGALAFTGTKRCDRCWELERRIQNQPDIALRILTAHAPRVKRCVDACEGVPDYVLASDFRVARALNRGDTWRRERNDLAKAAADVLSLLHGTHYSPTVTVDALRRAVAALETGT